MSKIDEPADAKLQAIHYGDQVRYLEDGQTRRGTVTGWRSRRDGKRVLLLRGKDAILLDAVIARYREGEYELLFQ